MNLDLELDKVVDFINKNNCKVIYIQLPDGIKPKANFIQEFIEDKTDSQVVIWAGSCFGACDVPKVDCDLFVQFGHSEW